MEESPMAAWRPIATAPRDGTVVLVYMPDALEPKVALAQWVEDEWTDAWREDGCRPIDAEPTRWLPVPSLPRQRP
jgi:hypothetical protein